MIVIEFLPWRFLFYLLFLGVICYLTRSKKCSIIFLRYILLRCLWCISAKFTALLPLSLIRLRENRLSQKKSDELISVFWMNCFEGTRIPKFSNPELNTTASKGSQYSSKSYRWSIRFKKCLLWGVDTNLKISFLIEKKSV